MKSKLVRNKVILGQSSLETLIELNKQAEKVECAVVIGILPAGTPLMGGLTGGPVPFYMVLESSMFKDPEVALEESHIGFTREEVLTRLLDRAKKVE